MERGNVYSSHNAWPSVFSVWNADMLSEYAASPNATEASTLGFVHIEVATPDVPSSYLSADDEQRYHQALHEEIPVAAEQRQFATLHGAEQPSHTRGARVTLALPRRWLRESRADSRAPPAMTPWRS